MYYFIDEITSGVKMFNWANIISNNLSEQLRNLEKTRSFYMSSCIIYLLARNYKYIGLICKDIMGNDENKFKAYDCYPQLQLYEKSHFKRVNDAFLMYITRMLQRGTHQRLT